ncbi:MAG: molybdopterin-dependent oxidoreductase [Acidimicrobiia bacterium]
MTTLPPGQIETRRFPVVGERQPSADLAGAPDSWTVSVRGEVDHPMDMDLDGYMARRHQTFRFDIHCVTSWTRFDTEFSGVPVRDILEDAGVRLTARFVSFIAYSDRHHHTSLPLDVALDNSWLVHEVDGKSLESEHGGPVRVVTPGRYFYKSVKWIKRIDALAEDRLGWWEENSSYHNNADPTTGTERFTSGSLRPEQLQRFLDAESYDKYRGRVMLGLDLRRWAPASKDLARLCLKNCDLRGVDLSGTDMRGCNLSLSDLSGANLTGADLSGSDVEGANFTGANLRGTNLSNSALSATRFHDGVTSAEVDGMVAHGVWGLVEGQEEFLLARSVELSRRNG